MKYRFNSKILHEFQTEMDAFCFKQENAAFSFFFLKNNTTIVWSNTAGD